MVRRVVVVQNDVDVNSGLIVNVSGEKGTVSTEEKAVIASEAGCDHVVNYVNDDFRDAAVSFTNGRGVDVVYDSVGAATYERSMASLAPLGTLVCFGNSSGPVPPIDPLMLTKMGSLFLTRPTMSHYVATRDMYV